MREILPQRRASQTFSWPHGNQWYDVSVGYYQDNRVGEIFINGPKVGSDMEALCRDAAVLMSISIQHGVPLDVFRHAITREQDGKASTILGAVLDRLLSEEL